MTAGDHVDHDCIRLVYRLVDGNSDVSCELYPPRKEIELLRPADRKSVV